MCVSEGVRLRGESQLVDKIWPEEQNTVGEEGKRMMGFQWGFDSKSARTKALI